MANDPKSRGRPASRGPTTGERRAAARPPTATALPAVEKTPRQKLQTAFEGDSEFSVKGKPKPDLKIPDANSGAPSAEGGPAKAWHFLRKIFK